MNKHTYELNNSGHKPFVFFDTKDLVRQLKGLPQLHQTVPNGWELVASVDVAEFVPTRGQISFGQLIESIKIFVADQKNTFGFAFTDDGTENNRTVGIFKEVPLLIKS